MQIIVLMTTVYTSLSMWGFTIYLMRLADYFRTRKDRLEVTRLEKNRVYCRVCGKRVGEQMALDEHMKKEHSELV
jgi:hypothetical protein